MSAPKDTASELSKAGDENDAKRQRTDDDGAEEEAPAEEAPADESAAEESAAEEEALAEPGPNASLVDFLLLCGKAPPRVKCTRSGSVTRTKCVAPRPRQAENYAEGCVGQRSETSRILSRSFVAHGTNDITLARYRCDRSFNCVACRFTEL